MDTVYICDHYTPDAAVFISHLITSRVVVYLLLRDLYTGNVKVNADTTYSCA